MSYYLQSPEGYYVKRENDNPHFPVNPHRFYKQLNGTDPKKPRPRSPSPPPRGDCGYGEEDDTDGGHCYVKTHTLDNVIVRVRICLMPDGTMKTTHETRLKTTNVYDRGIRVLNNSSGNTDCRTITKDFMLITTAPSTGTYKTMSKLPPRVNYLTKNQTDERFVTKDALTAAIAGSAVFAVSVYWIWKAIMFYKLKEIGEKLKKSESYLELRIAHPPLMRLKMLLE